MLHHCWIIFFSTACSRGWSPTRTRTFDLLKVKIQEMTLFITESFLTGSHQDRMQILIMILPAGFRTGPIRTTAEPLRSKIRLILETFILFDGFMIKTSLELNLNYVMDKWSWKLSPVSVFQSFSVRSWTRTSQQLRVVTLLTFTVVFISTNKIKS